MKITIPTSMVKKSQTSKPQSKDQSAPVQVGKGFHLEFLTPSQRLAWQAFQQHDVLFMLGPAGTGKTLLASAFGVTEILRKTKQKLVLTRPIVESGESLGYLPGTFDEKINPYMMPLYDSIDKICGSDGRQKELIKESTELVPIAYMRGRTFENAVFILDEAQNCTRSQLKLALTRFGKNSKMIITGDPDQSDLPGEVALADIVYKLRTVTGIGVVIFKENSIVRHPLIAKILAKIN